MAKVLADVRFRRVRGCSSVGRASVFQTECREFESRRPLQAIEFTRREFEVCVLEKHFDLKRHGF